MKNLLADLFNTSLLLLIGSAVRTRTRTRTQTSESMKLLSLSSSFNNNSNNLPAQSPSPPVLPSPLHNKDLRKAQTHPSIILIDVENVRGKTFFHLTHRELLKRITAWAKTYNLEDRVCMVVDHGTGMNKDEDDNNNDNDNDDAMAYYLKEGGIGVVFAGPMRKADDVIARDVGYFGRDRHRHNHNGNDVSGDDDDDIHGHGPEDGVDLVVVITSDHGLIARCRGSMNRAVASSMLNRSVQFMDPIRFLKDLDRLNQRLEGELAQIHKLQATRGHGHGGSVPVSADSDSVKKRTRTRTGRRNTSSLQLYKHLAHKLPIPTTDQSRTDASTYTSILNSVLSYDVRFEDETLLKWEEERQKKQKRREKTDDRVFLAECFRKMVAKVVSEEEDVDDEYSRGRGRGRGDILAGDGRGTGMRDGIGRSASLRYVQYVRDL